jgi:hypothetical protein
MLTYADVWCTQGVCPMRLEADGAGVEKARVLLTYNSKPEAFRYTSSLRPPTLVASLVA